MTVVFRRNDLVCTACDAVEFTPYDARFGVQGMFNLKRSMQLRHFYCLSSDQQWDLKKAMEEEREHRK